MLNASFLGAFCGTAAACLVASIAGRLRWGEPSAGYLVLGGALSLVGTFLVTIAFNVPGNDALAALGVDHPRAPPVWAGFVPDWTAWNHVRAVAALVAVASLTFAYGPSLPDAGPMARGAPPHQALDGYRSNTAA